MKDNQALLWYLHLKSGSDQEKSPGAYLLGTMHSAHASALIHMPRFTHYILQSKHYYAESNLDSPIFKNGLNLSLQPNKNLDALMGSKLFAKASTHLERHYDLFLNRFSHLPPMMISALIGEKLMGATSGPALDIQLWNIAKSHDLILDGIESAHEQHAIYRRIPMEYQIGQLKGLLKNISKSTSMLSRLADAYHDQDLIKLYKLSKASLGPIRDILLYERNEVMANRIFYLLKNNQELSFVAIGAAHLPGVKGVLRKLKQLGVSLQAIRF